MKRPHCVPAVLGVVAMLLLAIPDAAARADDQAALATVMQKYGDAVGGEKLLASIKTLKTVYSSSLMGRPVTITTFAKAPSSFLQRVAVDGTQFSIVAGFDGKTAWTKTLSGAVQTLSGDQRALMISQAAALNNSELLPDRWPTTLSLKPNESVAGVTYYVVSVQPQGGSAHDLLLDSHTYLPEISREYQGNATVLTTAKSFGKGPLGETTGALLVTTRSDGSLPDVTSKLVSVEDNIKVDDSIFAPPLSQKGSTSI